MSIRDIANQYFACVHAHDAEGLGSLFAEDGWLRPPPPITESVQGPEAIRSFYARLFESVPDLRIDPGYQLIVDGNVCVARFSSWAGGRHNTGVIDVFTANERGELIEMTAYARDMGADP